MNQTRNTLRTASTAIAAVLALSSTATLAQATAPVIVLPDAAPEAAAPSAVPSAPEAAAAPTVSAPVVQAVPVADAAAEPARVEPAVAPVAAAPRSTATQRVTRTVAPVAPAEAPRATTQMPVSAAPVAAALPVEQTVAAAPPVQTAAPVVDDEDSLAGPLLGGAAVLGLGLLGFAAMRRRKPRATETRVVERPNVVRNVNSADPALAAVAAVPQQTTPAAAPIRTEYAFDRHAPATAFQGRSGAVALPLRAPEANAERTALLRRMVDARPDRANPFVSRKSRTRRAKLILQSLGHDFADRDPLFDLSDYPQNWPLVARRKYATAA